MIVGVGIDLVDVDRFRRSLARTPSLPARLFREGERRYAESANDPALRYAARFAAKEAVMKSLGVGIGAFKFRDVEVFREDDGRPSLWLHGAAEQLASARGVTAWQISMTHTATSAGAVVVALGA